MRDHNLVIRYPFQHHRETHLYILPKLELKTRDVTLLQDALEMVESQIATTSKNILSKNSGICLTEYSLKPQRDKLFTENNFESETYLKISFTFIVFL
jgi:hypothetical protein